MKIAICDDEIEIGEQIKDLIRSQKTDCRIEFYSSGEELLASEVVFDIIFLDIQMEGMDGLSTARQLRRKTDALLIFITGIREAVFDAFDVGAFQYLLKPVDEEKFAQVFARAVAQIGTTKEKPGRVLTLQSANTSRTVPLDSIYYIESSNHKVELHLKDGEFACYAKIGDLELELQDQFFRIHKGYLVNLSYVAGYSKRSVTLTNGERLLLSKYKYQDFVKAYLHFLKKGAGL